MNRLLKLLSLGLTLLTFNAQAVIELYEFNTPQQEVLYHQMILELRCVVCQNQNLAESNAPIAQDLRRQLHKLITENNADKQQIVDYMTERYGDFVLYKPPLQANTLLLWLGPILLLFFALFLGVQFIKRSQQEAK